MVQETQGQLKKLKQEQIDVEQEIKTLQRRQEDFFQLQKKEERAYTLLVDASMPEERQFFKDRGENSLYLARKAQAQLNEQEEQAKKQKKTLQEQEDEVQRLIQDERNKREEEN